MLGPAYRWIDSEDGSYLQLRSGCVARVRKVPPDKRGRTVDVQIGGAGKEVGGRAGSVAQGKRFVEQYLAGQDRGRYRVKSRPAPPAPPRRERTPAEIREWQRREAEQSARMMAESGWRDPMPTKKLTKRLTKPSPNMPIHAQKPNAPQS